MIPKLYKIDNKSESTLEHLGKTKKFKCPPLVHSNSAPSNIQNINQHTRPL